MKLNWAERWAVNNPTRVVQQWFELRWLAGRVTLPERGEALELGCGRGAAAPFILARFPLARLHLTDLDPAMVVRAAAASGGALGARTTHAVAEGERLPFRDRSFDAVFAFGVLHHIPDWRRALAEVARVLRPGGVYVYEEILPLLYLNPLARRVLLHPTEDRFSAAELRAAVDGAGFERVADLTVPGFWLLGAASRKA